MGSKYQRLRAQQKVSNGKYSLIAFFLITLPSISRARTKGTEPGTSAPWWLTFIELSSTAVCSCTPRQRMRRTANCDSFMSAIRWPSFSRMLVEWHPLAVSLSWTTFPNRFMSDRPSFWAPNATWKKFSPSSTKPDHGEIVHVLMFLITWWMRFPV